MHCSIYCDSVHEALGSTPQILINPACNLKVILTYTVLRDTGGLNVFTKQMKTNEDKLIQKRQ